MAAKEKINLLDVIPCRSEHITVEREGETIVLSLYVDATLSCSEGDVEGASCAFGRTRNGCMGTD